MKRKLYIISVVLMFVGGALYYCNFDAFGCALMLLGTSMYILTYIGTRSNQRNEQSNIDYTNTTWYYMESNDSSSDCSS